MKNYLIGWVGGASLTFAFMFGFVMPHSTERAVEENSQQWEEALQDYGLCLSEEEI